MVQAATVSLFELSVLEEQLGGDPIESIEDIPAVAIARLHEATLRSSDYRISEVSRGFSTEFVHYAGQEVFVLDDGTCQYAMKYFTSIFDSALVDEDAIATLGDRFTNLPDGYSFSVQTFDEDLLITETEGIQFVLTDEFGNSYDRFACD